MFAVSGIKNLTNLQLGINQNNAVNFKSDEIKPDSVELSNKKKKTKTILEIVGASAVAIIGIIFAVKHFKSKNIKEVAPQIIKDAKNVVENNIGGCTNTGKTSSKATSIKTKLEEQPSKPKNNSVAKALPSDKFEEEMLKYVTPTELENLKTYINTNAKLISKDKALMFAQIKDLKDEAFTKKAYELMVKLLGYEKCAPELKFTPRNEHIKASCGTFTGDIEFEAPGQSRGTHFEGSTLRTLRHELEHFIQNTTIARTEGLGINAICEAHARAIIRQTKIDKECCLHYWHKPFEEINKTEAEMFQELCARNKAEINTEFYQKVIEEKGIIPKDSPEAKKAKLYFDAQANYTYVSRTDDEALINDYDNNLLEKEAESVGHHMDNDFLVFKTLLKSPIESLEII